MPMVPEDITTALTSFASAGTLDQGKRYLMTESAALIKFQQYRISEAENRQKQAQRDVMEIKQLNEALKARMAGMVSMQDYFRKHLSEMLNMKLPNELMGDEDDKGQRFS